MKKNAQAVKTAAILKRQSALKISTPDGTKQIDELEQLRFFTPAKSDFNQQSDEIDAALPSTANTDNDSASASRKRPRIQDAMSPRNLFNTNANKRACTDDLSDASATNREADDAKSESNKSSKPIELAEADIKYIRS